MPSTTFRSLVFSLLMLMGFAATAQDTLLLMDNTKVLGKVTLVGEYEITYKKAETPDGPDYNIKRYKVVMISYQNGRKDVLNPKQRAAFERDTAFGRHMITFEFADILRLNASASYEYFLKSGRVGLRVPLSVGINPYGVQYVFGGNRRLMSAGFEVNFYSKKPSATKFFYGPSIRYCQTRYSYLYQEYVSNPYSNTLKNEQGKASNYLLRFNLGFLSQPSDHFVFVGAFGIGAINEYRKGRNYGYRASAGFRFSVGYRF